MSAPYLILNQPQVFNGLGTLTYTVLTAGAYNVQVQATVPQAIQTGDGAGSGFGLGSGTGGGGEGFTQGDQGLGKGGVGQGFGPGNSYQQPPSYGSNASTGPAVSSGLSIVVNQNGSPILTLPTLSATQSAYQAKISFLAAVNDSITVVISSSVASDEILNGPVSIISIGQGL